MPQVLLPETPAPASTIPPARGSRSSQPRRALVRREVAAWRRRHPELCGEITEAGLRAVLEREWITLRPHGGSAGLLGRALTFMGHRGIILHSELRGLAWLVVVLHEIGHLALNALSSRRRAPESHGQPRMCGRSSVTRRDTGAVLMPAGVASSSPTIPGASGKQTTPAP